MVGTGCLVARICIGNIKRDCSAGIYIGVVNTLSKRGITRVCGIYYNASWASGIDFRGKDEAKNHQKECDVLRKGFVMQILFAE